MELRRERHGIEYQTEKRIEGPGQSVWILPQRLNAGDASEVGKL